MLSARLAEARHEPSQLELPGTEFEELITALGQLSSTDQELLRLSSWDGLTRAEIAMVLGIKENAVDQRLHRARARLKGRYEQVATSSPTATPKEASS
jgi:RNA polymerase sigma-70 factor (ECF subfamily)